MDTTVRIRSHRRYIYISILAIDPTYFINAYGEFPTSQKKKKNRGAAGVPWLVMISNILLWVSR
jgi:hypothetical protein